MTRTGRRPDTLYQGIRYENIELSQSGAVNFLNCFFRYHVYLKPLLSAFRLSRQDYFYFYSDFLDIARYVRKLLPEDHISYQRRRMVSAVPVPARPA